MFTPNPDEIVIYGTTCKGKVFRPSDWAERLCGILSSFDKGNRLSYHEWVRPLLVGKVRSVAVGTRLETINPPMFRFLMDFAADNDLQVLDADGLAALTREQPPAAAPVPEQSTPAPQPAPATEAEHSLIVREIAAGDTKLAFPALSVLRPDLTDANHFAEQVDKGQRPEGYRLFGVFEAGKNNAVAVCGLRTATSLSAGRYILIDDLVTVPQMRGRGCCRLLLQAVAALAQAENIAQIHAAADAGLERAEAHRLYFRHGFAIGAYRFVCQTDSFRP